MTPGEDITKLGLVNPEKLEALDDNKSQKVVIYMPEGAVIMDRSDINISEMPKINTVPLLPVSATKVVDTVPNISLLSQSQPTVEELVQLAVAEMLRISTQVATPMQIQTAKNASESVEAPALPTAPQMHLTSEELAQLAVAEIMKQRNQDLSDRQQLIFLENERVAREVVAAQIASENERVAREVVAAQIAAENLRVAREVAAAQIASENERVVREVAAAQRELADSQIRFTGVQSEVAHAQRRSRFVRVDNYKRRSWAYRVNTLLIAYLLIATIFPLILSSMFGLSAHASRISHPGARISSGDLMVSHSKLARDLVVNDIILIRLGQNWKMDVRKVTSVTSAGKMVVLKTISTGNKATAHSEEFTKNENAYLVSKVIPHLGYVPLILGSGWMKTIGLLFILILNFTVFLNRFRRPRLNRLEPLTQI